MTGVSDFPKWVQERFYLIEDAELIYADDQVVINKSAITHVMEMLDTFTVYTGACGIRFKRHPKHILTIITK